MEPTMPPQNEQLTIRIDANGKILKIDSSQLRPHCATFLAKEIGNSINALVHPQDQQRLQLHLKEVINGQSDFQFIHYRIKLDSDTYAHTKVQSRMFRSDVPGEPDFVMAVHEIISDSEIMAMESGSYGSNLLGIHPSASHSMTSHHLQQKHSHGALGGPLMTSVINGGSLSQISPRNGNHSLNENSSLLHPPSSDSYFNSDAFDFDFASSTFEIENPWTIDSRPDSRTSMVSVSTPRPSSATAAFSPAPLTPYHNNQPSPASMTNNNNNNNNNTSMANNNLTGNNVNAAGGSNNIGSSGFNSAGSNSSSNFQFSYEDNKEKVQEQLQKLQQQENSSSASCSDRLRNLLTKSPHPSGSGMDNTDQERARNQILKVRYFFFFHKNI